jgi:sulfonate transport system ATP-binding protein
MTYAAEQRGFRPRLVPSIDPDAEVLVLDGVEKEFTVDGRPVQALARIDLQLRRGEFVCLIGASGCGKSTILRMIAGLDRPTAGEVRVAGKAVHGPGLDRSLVFQEHRLLPWATVEQNVFLALDAVPLDRAEKWRRVAEHLALVGLTDFARAYPSQLSGGMAQRAAIARGLVANPAILLLDEPLGALDSLTRSYLQDELLRIWEAEGTTTLMVTHDVEEALLLADRVVVLDPRPGRVRQIVRVDLPRPRRRGDPELAALKEQVLGELRHL